jgi:hypothetical protein
MPLSTHLIPNYEFLGPTATEKLDREFEPRVVLDAAACVEVIGATIDDALLRQPEVVNAKQPEKVAVFNAVIGWQTLVRLRDVLLDVQREDAAFAASQRDGGGPTHDDWRRSLRSDDGESPDEAVRRSARQRDDGSFHRPDVGHDDIDQRIHRDATRDDASIAGSFSDALSDARDEANDGYDERDETVPPRPDFERMAPEVCYQQAIRYYVQCAMMKCLGRPSRAFPRLRPIVDLGALTRRELDVLVRQVYTLARSLRYSGGRGEDFAGGTR